MEVKRNSIAPSWSGGLEIIPSENNISVSICIKLQMHMFPLQPVHVWTVINQHCMTSWIISSFFSLLLDDPFKTITASSSVNWSHIILPTTVDWIRHATIHWTHSWTLSYIHSGTLLPFETLPHIKQKRLYLFAFFTTLSVCCSELESEHKRLEGDKSPIPSKKFKCKFVFFVVVGTKETGDRLVATV